MSNLTVRILVALVAIPLIVALCLLGGYYFFAMVVFIATLGLHEYYAVARNKGANPHVATGILFGFFVMCAFMWGRLRDLLIVVAPGVRIELQSLAVAQVFEIVFLLFVPLVLLVELFRNSGSAIINAAVTVFGVCYVSTFLGSFIGLRELFAAERFPMQLFFETSGEQFSADAVNQVSRWGGATVITVFASLWMCDSLAYFAGRFLGRHKLFERVSPKKTWEGATAGYVGAVATFLVAQNFFLPYMSVGNAFVCGSIVGIFGQLGDLAESLLKRDAGVKDSSALIPGHGGVLDRFDSLIFVSPLIFFYLDFIVL